MLELSRIVFKKMYTHKPINNILIYIPNYDYIIFITVPSVIRNIVVCYAFKKKNGNP